MKIVVIGASTDSGRQVVRLLCDLGHEVTAVSRSADRLADVDARARRAIFDIDRPTAPTDALAGADRIVSVAHAATAETLLSRLPPACGRVVLTGSTRRDSAVPDPASAAVRRGEAAFLRAGVPGTMLHPTMIYGGRRERNVIRVLEQVDRWPRWLPLVWPVPGGGRSLIQPVHVDDVAAALVAAATAPGPLDRTIVVAGPQPMRLADMLRACAASRGRRLHIVPLPTGLLIAVARLLRAVTGRSPFSVAELRRAREDKAYDIAALRTQLGVEPVPFDEGLRRGR